MTIHDDGGRAGREATDWLIALREAPDDVELRARFDAWLAADPANRAAWAETRRLLDVLSLTRRPPPARAPTRAQLRERPRPAWRRLPAVAATAALAACLLLAFGPGLVVQLEATDVTATAEIRRLTLDDGSVVQLGPESAIDVSLEPTERRVRLLKGEAFFEVRPDAARPFIVEAGPVRTTVLGTSFDVRRGGEATDVAVREGVVHVSDRRATPPVSEKLAAGDYVRVEVDGRVLRGTRPADEIAPWLRGEIVAGDRTISDLVDELRRYHPAMIVIADGGLARERVTGVYNLADPPAALRAVASAHGARVREISPWLVVLTR